MKPWPLFLLLSCCTDAAPDQVLIRGATFIPGNDASYREERSGPAVTIGPFSIDTHEVTNAQFSAFVAATGYKTLGERGFFGDPKVPLAQQMPGGVVFVMPSTGVRPGWIYLPGADWRHPDGPQSSIEGRDKGPVVQVTFADALAYAKWKGRDLPTEEEWEWAAGGGKDVPGRERPLKDGKSSANNWDGIFPIFNTGGDGFIGRAPVGRFAPNVNRLYDMTGNVWELTKSAWNDSHAQGAKLDLHAHVIKGGSYLCAQNFCARYRPQSRQLQETDLGTNHIGFRTVKRQTPG